MPFDEDVAYCADTAGDDMKYFYDCMEAVCDDCNSPNISQYPPSLPSKVANELNLLTYVFMGTTISLLSITFIFILSICYYIKIKKLNRQQAESGNTEQNGIPMVTLVINPDSTSFVLPRHVKDTCLDYDVETHTEK